MHKIAFVANSCWSLWRFRLTVMRKLAASGFKVIIVAPRDDKTLELENAGFEWFDVKMSRKGLNPICDLITLRRLFSIYKTEIPDFIYHYTIKPNIYGTLAASLLGIRSIAVVTGLGSVYLRDNWLTKLVTIMYRVTLRRAYQIWFLNEADAAEFSQRGILKEQRQPHGFMLGSEGLNLEEFAPRSKKSRNPVFLLVARMLTDKGVLDFVEAARIIRKSRHNVEFRLMGPLDPGNPSGLSADQIRQLEEDGTVKYLGARDDVRDEMADADCLVLPSYKEGMPRVLMEAAAMGKPALTTNVPGCRDIVVDGETGFLCNPGAPRDLAASMERFLQLSEPEKLKMGRMARQRATLSYDEEQVATKYLAVTTEVLDGLPKCRTSAAIY